MPQQRGLFDPELLFAQYEGYNNNYHMRQGAGLIAGEWAWGSSPG